MMAAAVFCCFLLLLLVLIYPDGFYCGVGAAMLRIKVYSGLRDIFRPPGPPTGIGDPLRGSGDG